MAIVKATKIKFTAGRIRNFHCPNDKERTYLWCDEVKGLGAIATIKGAKSYIFQAKVDGKSMRLTIGDVGSWSIPAAQAEARRLQTVIDTGDDPRKVKAAQDAAKIEQASALILKNTLEQATLRGAWTEYLNDRKQFWGERHYKDHEEVMHEGGKKRLRSKKLTEPGVLASLADVRLVDLTPERVTQWAKLEGEKRAGRARLAARLLKAFLSWCEEQPVYGLIVTGNAAKNKKTREHLGKPKSLDEVIQREQLKAWFEAVNNIGNRVISVYLQGLLLTGARPNELAAVKWEDVNFQWERLTIRDKYEGVRVIPLTPYFSYLLASLPCRNLTPKQAGASSKHEIPNPYIFSSVSSASGHLEDAHDAHYKICAATNMSVPIYGLRRSFATLSEWIEMPAGIAAQIQGHKPSGVREKHYIRRPLDLLRMWHIKIEEWLLSEAGIVFAD